MSIVHSHRIELSRSTPLSPKSPDIPILKWNVPEKKKASLNIAAKLSSQADFSYFSLSLILWCENKVPRTITAVGRIRSRIHMNFTVDRFSSKNKTEWPRRTKEDASWGRGREEGEEVVEDEDREGKRLRVESFSFESVSLLLVSRVAFTSAFMYNSAECAEIKPPIQATFV